MVRNKAFTLIEILIVIGIISLITIVGIFSFSQANKSARDATRRADIQRISQALELFRSNNAYSSYPTNLSDVVDAKYLTELPHDPQVNQGHPDYVYDAGSCSPLEGAPSDQLCTTYAIAADLETSTSNYVLTPNGQVTPTLSPTATLTPTNSLTPTTTRTPTPTPTLAPASCTTVCHASTPFYQSSSCRNSCNNITGGWFTPNPNSPSTCTGGQVCCCQ